MSTATGSDNTQGRPPVPQWQGTVDRYQRPAAWRALWQVTNTIVPYVALWYLMYLSLSISLWLAIPLAVLAGAFLVRVFIIFHDCGHGSFLRSTRANDLLGMVTGFLTFTPYHHWRREHSIHHGSAGNLDRRGTGDVWTLTVEEYLESSRWRRFGYRLSRNPVVLFVLAPLALFVIKHRIPSAWSRGRERRSVHITNLAVLLMVAGLAWLFGIQAYLVLQLTVLAVAGSSGVWLFYVQHQFEGVYWARREDWDFEKAALQGSSYYKLPHLLQWFSGNIGFHHIHHLEPRIPNYNLPKCHRAEPAFQRVPAVTLLGSLKSFTFRLWDEQRQQLISFGRLRRLRREASQAT